MQGDYANESVRFQTFGCMVLCIIILSLTRNVSCQGISLNAADTSDWLLNQESTTTDKLLNWGFTWNFAS